MASRERLHRLQLVDLVGLIRRRNRIDRRIAQLIGRPATNGNIGEAVAAAIFDIDLAPSGVTPGHDGRFRSGPFVGRAVNIKLYAEDARGLDIGTHPADTYLVLTGPKPSNLKGRSLPVRIDSVYLIDEAPLLEDLRARGVGIGVATSVRKDHWERARIYPPNDKSVWPLSEEQLSLLGLFAWQPAPEVQLRPAQTTVVGVDGAPVGWVAVELFDRRIVGNGVRVFRTFDAVVEEYSRRADVIAVDMPIGLTDAGEREADRLARAFIGPKLRATVFSTRPRWALQAKDYAAARSTRPHGAKGVSAQAFALVPRIREVERAIEHGARVYEVHPEVSFRALKAQPLDWPKKTSEGREERLELLEAVGILPPETPLPGATLEDVIDACGAAWSAHRIATKTSRTFSEEADASPFAACIHY